MVFVILSFFAIPYNPACNSKIFLGLSFNEIVALGKKIFKEVKVFKPKASRKESKESFIICKILR